MAVSRRSLLAAASLPLLRLQARDFPDLSTVAADLSVPDIVPGDPAPGRRVRQTDPAYAGSDVHHTLYLPRDWKPGKRYPVLVEYAGNGNYANRYGDVSTGEVEGSKLGYGISGGRKFIWVCLPYVNRLEGKNQITWWGDVDATVRYARDTVARICAGYGGDPGAVILCGFSRGAIACNYIGLHDETIAPLWLAFIAYSNYDGVKTTWPYPDASRAAAVQRLKRLRGRPVFVCQEQSVESTRAYLAATGVRAPFTFQPLAFRNHNDAWALRDIPERKAVRRWLEAVLKQRGHSVPGQGGRLTTSPEPG